MGRERETEEVKSELAMTRLLTLTGVGGSGKTRLALEVARDLVAAYPDGAWLVELAALSEEALVSKAAAEALELPERPAEPLADTLSEALRDRQLLLILDNCEHLLEASARLVDKLLDSCPRVRILATSREGLGVEGEVRWPVPPLSVPEPQGALSSAELEASGSVRLFLERAAALAEEAAALCQEAGDRLLLPLPLTWLGWVALLRDDLERAKALHKESLALSNELGTHNHLTLTLLEGLACTAGAEGATQKAARLFGAAQALREATGFPLAPALRTLEEPYLVGAHSQLEEGVWTETWEEGGAMSMQTAIEYALAEEDLSTTSSAPEQPPSSAREHPAELTPREVEVLGLVAEGDAPHCC